MNEAIEAVQAVMKELPDPSYLSDFERRIERIADKVLSNGIRTMSAGKAFDPFHADPATMDAFLAACHQGFSLGQRSLVDELSRLQEEKAEAKRNLKKARREGNRAKETAAQILIHVQERHIQMVRKLADCILWTLSGNRRWVIRRLYAGHTQPRLATSNFESLLKVTDELYDEKLLRFALILDLTSVAQVGDLLIVQKEEGAIKMSLAEVKEGAMNEKIADLLDNITPETAQEQFIEFGSRHGEKAFEQVGRVIKQQARMHSTAQVLNTNRGADLLTGMPIVLPKEEFRYANYEDVLRALLSTAAKEGHSFAVVDRCLALGVFDPKRVSQPALEFCTLMHEWQNPNEPQPTPSQGISKELIAALKPPYPVTNVGEASLTVPLAKPFFLRGAQRERILDVVFGRLRVYAYLDVGLLVEMAQEVGVAIEWTSPTESRQLRRNGSHKGLFQHEGRFLRQHLGEAEVLLGDGLFAQIVWDGMRPLSAIEALLSRPATIDKELVDD